MIEQTLERIACALEKLAGSTEITPPVEPVATVTRKPRAKKMESPAPVEDAVPGEVEAPTAPDVMADETAVKTGTDLRNYAQKLIQAADQSDAGGKNGTTNKLVTFIQSVAKIFNPAEPKLIKIPEAKVQEAADMITNWCNKNGIQV